MTAEQKRWIDNATYDRLLGRWRNAPIGDSMFQGDTGDYYRKVMNEKRAAMTAEEHVAASKRIGWGGSE